jgi:alanine racemase
VNVRLEIDPAALRANLAQLRSTIAPARVAAVVKANAYGHGLVPVARAIASAADLLCVFSAGEAAALREAGIASPLLIIGPTDPADLPAALAARAAITLWSSGAYARDVARAASAAGRPFPVHLKIDTGVTRFGCEPEEAAASIAALEADPSAFSLEGVSTHLAAAEELESAFTREQLRRFDAALVPAGDLRGRGILRHAAASAAAMLYPESRYDLARVGIATYGIWPSPQTQAAAGKRVRLEPALRWTASLAVVRDVEAGRSIGYGCTYATTRPARIGVIPAGYAEGIPRSSGGRASVLICGKRAPLVGRICMDVAFADVTEIPQAHAGSEVTLLGRDGTDAIGAEEWANWAGTIAYEIVARLPSDLPRTVADQASTAAIASARSSVPS